MELLHQGDLVFDVISSTPASSTTTIDTYNAETGAVSLSRVAVGNETFSVKMQHQSALLFKVTSAQSITTSSTTSLCDINFIDSANVTSCDDSELVVTSNGRVNEGEYHYTKYLIKINVIFDSIISY